MFGLALTAPGSTVRDINDWIDGQIQSGSRPIPEMNKLTATQ
jgi:hypothetical protein